MASEYFGGIVMGACTVQVVSPCGRAPPVGGISLRAIMSYGGGCSDDAETASWSCDGV